MLVINSYAKITLALTPALSLAEREGVAGAFRSSGVGFNRASA
jgi:hypothetical protein